MRFSLLLFVLSLIYNPAVSQYNEDQFLVVSHDTVMNEYCEYKISVYYQKGPNIFQKLIETENQLEYFDYLGKILSEDGNEYHLFKSYSLSVGTISLYYFSTKECLIYHISGMQEHQIPYYFTFNSEQRYLNILSYDVVDCGSITKKHVTDFWSGNDRYGKYSKCIPGNQKVMKRISF